jgi:DNA-binding Xre family transcriptional regulator
MGITYKRLREIKIQRRLHWQDIQNGSGISAGTIVKINKDEYITLNNLEKIARFLNCDIGDLVEIKKEL